MIMHRSMKGGQEKEVETPPGDEEENTPNVEIQERGDIYFFYRPKVGEEDPHTSDDVQRLYIVLRPHTSSQDKQQQEKKKKKKKEPPQEEKSMLLRLIVMGKKSLPDPSKRGRPYWGFVELVTTKIQDIKDALKGEEYDTKTRGHRHKPAARALGEGVYRILKHHSGKKMHTHLIYKLEFPSEGAENQPQEELNVEREASFLIQIKNPIQGQFKTKTTKKKKKKSIFPAHLQGQFGKLRYHGADPPDFLNYEGCEFLLISASDEIHEELGLEIEVDRSCSDLVNTFGETVSADALLRGIWV
ncbi:uncharacterized protein LOC110865029 isoform X2 [Helianthus annuus]|uniref:Uncharacterized protein n=1 Tax=Helianthus annuus TaxID=4232 RepID=A0A251UHQ6_HELAN|nr:uncharacterized protein LOC110865029 isoform X2 [Helianthus annuus]